MDTDYLDARITAAKALIISYETALTACASETVQSFTLNTGQTIQTATYKDQEKILNSLSVTMNYLTILEARRYGGALQVRPGW